MKNIALQIRGRLKEMADPATRESGRRFFKPDEKIVSHGTKAAEVKRLVREIVKETQDRPKKDIWALGEILWRSGYMEEGWIASELAHARRAEYQPADFEVLEGWLARYVGNWASCDTLCNHSLGAFVDRFPEFVSRLKEWTGSENRWLKRGAAVSLIIPAREGRFLTESLEIAELLINDGDDLVQKGYGWLLKAASQAHPDEVYAYLLSRRATMPRTAFRYALEKMSQERRAEAMRK